MTKEKRRKRKKPKRPKLNRYGDTLAIPIRTAVIGWICPKCGAISFGDKKGTPPIRCGNRKNCGRLFHRPE